MKTVSVRELQYDLATVLQQVSRGEEIAVTRHDRLIARIVPARAQTGPVDWPDSAARMKRLGPDAARGTPPSRILREMRGER